MCETEQQVLNLPQQYVVRVILDRRLCTKTLAMERLLQENWLLSPSSELHCPLVVLERNIIFLGGLFPASSLHISELGCDSSSLTLFGRPVNMCRCLLGV